MPAKGPQSSSFPLICKHVNTFSLRKSKIQIKCRVNLIKCAVNLLTAGAGTLVLLRACVGQSCECQSGWQVRHVGHWWNVWWTKISSHLPNCPRMKLSLSWFSTFLSFYLSVHMHIHTHRHTPFTPSPSYLMPTSWFSAKRIFFNKPRSATNSMFKAMFL